MPICVRPNKNTEPRDGRHWSGVKRASGFALGRLIGELLGAVMGLGLSLMGRLRLTDAL
jgi:tetrahydromethanopterin S-methyltransferase subunit G